MLREIYWDNVNHRNEKGVGIPPVEALAGFDMQARTLRKIWRVTGQKTLQCARCDNALQLDGPFDEGLRSCWIVQGQADLRPELGDPAVPMVDSNSPAA